jgi:hypothetical protein
MQEAPMQYCGELIEEVAVMPCMVTSPYLVCEIMPTLSGAVTLLFGGEPVGPVHAKTKVDAVRPMPIPTPPMAQSDLVSNDLMSIYK